MVISSCAGTSRWDYTKIPLTETSDFVFLFSKKDFFNIRAQKKTDKLSLWYQGVDVWNYIYQGPVYLLLPTSQLKSLIARYADNRSIILSHYLRINYQFGVAHKCMHRVWLFISASTHRFPQKEVAKELDYNICFYVEEIDDCERGEMIQHSLTIFLIV